MGLNIKYWVDQSLLILRANKQWEREQKSLRLVQDFKPSINNELEAKIKELSTKTTFDYTYISWATKQLRWYKTKQEVINIIDYCIKNNTDIYYFVLMSQQELRKLGISK